jgi:hypothetical protein
MRLDGIGPRHEAIALTARYGWQQADTEIDQIIAAVR